VATRAIEIDAPATDVWPWIAQMGPAPRGGAYTYDWIENLPASLVMERKMLFGMKERAERLAAERNA
jgi:hypothetical protein